MNKPDDTKQIPTEILYEVVRQQELMGWPEVVPKYAEVPDSTGKIFFKRFVNLSVADCEQLVECHSRKARTAIDSYKRTGFKYTLRTAGREMLYARLYRCRYISLMGKTDSTEADMPLAFGRY